MTVNAPSAGQSLTAGYGVSISNVGVVQNTKPAPAYRVAPSGGSDTIYQPDGVTQLRFLGFNHAFGSNLLTALNPKLQFKPETELV